MASYGRGGAFAQTSYSFSYTTHPKLPVPARQVPGLASNQTILTAFVTVCALMLLLIHVETCRLLIPSKGISRRDLHALTSGFANDISSRDDSPLSFHASKRRTRVCHIGFSHCPVVTSVIKALAHHPDILVNFRGRSSYQYDITTNELWRKTFISGHKVTIDSSVHFSHNTTNLKNLLDFDKHIRVLVTVCHPINRLVSLLLDSDSSSSKEKESLSVTPLAHTRPTRKLSPGDLSKRTTEGIIRTNNKTQSKGSNVHSFNVSRRRETTMDKNKESDWEKVRRLLKNHLDETNSKTVQPRLSPFLSKLGNVVTFIEQLHTFVPKVQILVLDEDKFVYNRTREITHLFRFLGLQDSFNSTERHNSSIVNNFRDSIDTAIKEDKTRRIREWLRRNHPGLVSEVHKLYLNSG